MFQINSLTKSEAFDILNSVTPPGILEYFNSSYDLQSKQIEFYQKNGFVKLSNVLEGKVLDYTRRVIQSAVLIREEADKRTLAEKSNYEQSFLQCGYLCFDYPAVKDFVFGKRFARIAGNLMKVEGIRLWHDQALFKEPGGRATPVHQDSSYWPVSNPELTTTIWLSLNGAAKDNGCLYFYPKSPSTTKEYVDIFNHPHEPEQLKRNKPIYMPVNAGDVTFHSGLTFHGTDGNITDDLREGMTIIYINDGNRFDSSDERNAAHKSCMGLKSGEVISTVYTPKLI